MTKLDLRNGMFGKDTDGAVFVVVDDKLIYEDGDYFPIVAMTDNLEFTEDDFVVELYEAVCFNQVKDGNGGLIWKRDVEKVEEKPVETTPEGSITITREQFFEVVQKANSEFMEVASKTPGNPLIDVVMGVQNLAFAALVETKLFGEDADDEEDDE